MPLTPRNSQTFLHALSDFWPLYFQDRELLRAYADGISINVAQLYQRFLESVLGSSLNDVPLFSKTFFRPYFIREDLVTFREGAAPEDDRYLFHTGDELSGGSFITNRVLAPTLVLLDGRDFRVTPGLIEFPVNPFNGGLSNFPERTAQVTAPASWVDPLGRTWGETKPGDLLRLRVGAVTFQVAITGVDGATLFLADAPPGITQGLSRRGGAAVVTRTPYDPALSGHLLPDHPSAAVRLSEGASDGLTVASSREVNVTALSNYRGAWAVSTAYAVGDLVSHTGVVWRALTAHTSGGSFSATPWDDLSSGYFYVTCPAAPRYTQVISAETPSTSGRIKLAAGEFTTATSVFLRRVTYASDLGARPSFTLPHRHQTPGSTSVVARRLVDHQSVDATGAATTYPAGENVQEGIDFTVDPDSGRLVVLSLWDPALPARVGYTWALEVERKTFAWRGAYAGATGYFTGDLIVSASVTYVVRRDHTSDGVLASDTYLRLVEPVTLDAPRTVREYAVWLTDALVDEHRLAKNFGDLLLHDAPSSEAQREFLRAVSRLFLLGPSFSLMTSALNAVLGLPLIRDANELLLSYDDGLDVSGTAARVFDTLMGTHGALVAATSRFSDPNALFLASDLSGSIRVYTGAAYLTYTVIAVVSATEVEVSPSPPVDASDLTWEMRHVALTSRLRVRAADYSFLPTDVGSWVKVTGSQPRNQGVFQIVSVDDPFTVELDTTYGFVDEGGVAWSLSARGTQRVTTNRRTYELPLNVPTLPALMSSSNHGVLRLPALSPVSDAVSIDDYLTDPTWWHYIQIPEELFSGTPAQRTVTPALIEHVYGAIDDAHVGDAGIHVGADEQSRVSTPRPFTATWYGGEEIVLTVTAPGPALMSKDVGSYLILITPGFEGAFQITRVHADGATVTLANFPPPEARGITPPRPLVGRLPELVFRHAVAFVLMDQALKYHCVRVRIDSSVRLANGVIPDLSRIVRASKPSHVFVFVEAGTVFADTITFEEELTLDLGLERAELLQHVESLAYISPSFLLRAGDAFRFEELMNSIVPTAGSSHVLPVTLPGGSNVVATLVKVGFDPAARVSGRMPAEGVDYTVDPATRTLTIGAGVTLTPDPVTVTYVVCIRRTIVLGDPMDPGEGYVAYGGSDPTLVRAPGQVATTAGLLDRTVQLTFGP